MRSKYAWLLLPPALALLMVFGPLKDMSKPPPSTSTTTNTAASARPTSVTEGLGSNLPELPGLWQVASSLVGVLLLGITVMLAVKHFRRPRPSDSGTEVLSLRQTLRLGAKQQIHVVEFGEQILLVGATDQHINLLQTRPESSADDESELLARNMDDEGAVPRDMILPRPPRRRKVAPKPPRSVRHPVKTKSSGARTDAEKTLRDFRALLKKAQAKAVQ